MRIKKSFIQFKIDDPSIKEKESYTNFIGVLNVIFYFLIILFPFISSYQKGKIGLNNLTNNKYNLISTALRHVNKPIQYLLLLISTITSTLFLIDKGFFLRPDLRLLVPISYYSMLFGIFLLTIILPEQFILHNVIGLFVIICGIVIVTFIHKEYTLYFVEDDLYKINNLYMSLIISVIMGVSVGIFNIYNNYIRKTKLWPNYIPFVRNLLGFFEILIFLIIGIVLYVTISYVPLPN